MFKPLLMQWMFIWMHPYCIKTMAVGRVANYGQQMSTNHTTTTCLRLVSTSDWITIPFYIYNFFMPLRMQWMFIWMHPYCIKNMEVGRVANSGQQMGTNHTTTTWLRMVSTSDLIKLSLYIYINEVNPLPMQWMLI